MSEDSSAELQRRSPRAARWCASIPSSISISLACALALLSIAAPAHAFDPFEIQVYDGTANDPHQVGLELHLNHVAKGVRTADPPQLAPHRQTHATFEPSFGLTRWWELGAYFQTSLRESGTFDYAGVKLRSKFVTTPAFHERFRLGINLEVSRVPDIFEADRWGGEVRPIAAYEDREWLFAVNPIVTVGLAGQGLRDGPAFEPAAMAYKKVRELVAFGLEYYGSFGPIAHPHSTRDQLHYLFGAASLLATPGWELNFGVGGSFTAAGNGMVLKTILGHVF